MDPRRRMSVIGTNRVPDGRSHSISESVAPGEYLMLKEELAQCRAELKEKNTALANLNEEFQVAKEEFSSIVDGLLSTVQSKSKEVNITRSELQLSRVQSCMIKKDNIPSPSHNRKESDILEEFKENLKHTRKRNKELRQENHSLQLELRQVLGKVKQSYTFRRPNICPLTEDQLALSQFSTEQEDVTEKRAVGIAHATAQSNSIQLIVELPRGGGTSSFFFTPAATIDNIKKAIFMQKLPHLRPNMFMFAVSDTELLDIEFVKILDAHSSFYDLYALKQPIRLTLFDKTVSRRLGDLRIKSFHEVKRSEEEEEFLRNLQANTGGNKLRIASSLRSAQMKRDLINEDQVMEPKPTPQGEEEVSLPLVSPDAIAASKEPPFEPITPDHFPICIITSGGIPMIVFLPQETDEILFRALLLDQLGDTIARLKVNQTIFFYENEENKDVFIPLEENSKVFEHPSVIAQQKLKRIPICSIGEACIFKNEEKVSAPPSPPPVAKKIDPEPIAQEKINPTVQRDIRTVEKAIPVLFHMNEQTREILAPRKANIESLKKMALQAFDKADNVASAVRYTIKVTGTSYFIPEGEHILEDLPIVQFCHKKGLMTTLSIVSKEKSKEEKLISKKIGLILTDDTGNDNLSWTMKDTDATDFRIKMSQIVGDSEFTYNKAIFAPRSGPIDFPLPTAFKVCIHLGEEGGTGLQDCSSVIKVTPSTTAHDLTRAAIKKFKHATNFVLVPEEYLIKICGFETYVEDSMTMESLPYVRECLQKKKSVSFSLIPTGRVPFLMNPSVERGESLLVNTPFDTALVDSYGDSDTVSLLELKTYFEVKVRAVDYLQRIGRKDGENFFIRCGIYHGGALVDRNIDSRPAVLDGGVVKWRRWLRSSLRLCELPEDCRLCITLYSKKDSSTSPVANVNVSLFDFKDHFRTGNVSLQMWVDGVANPIGTCMENVRAIRGTVPVIHLGFHTFPKNISFPHLQPLSHYGQNMTKPSEDEQILLVSLVDSDPLHRLEENDKLLLWTHREWLRKNGKPKALVKILQCVQWTSVQHVRDIYGLLANWDPVDPVDALQLLDAQFANRKVREYAVRWLNKLSDQELKDYLLQLVQTLKYEPNHFSPLGVWLLNRALQNQLEIGHSFFWHLKSELHVPEIAERFSLLLEMYLRGCGAEQREDLLKQVHVVNSLNQVALSIKSVPSSRRKAAVQKKLAALHLPNEFQLPLNPLQRASGLLIEKCKSMDSAKAPLWLVFKNADPLGDDIWLIFKSGDDLRQDSLTLQMLEIMDNIWLSEGLDLCLTPYKCIATGDEMGMIETVLDSDTAANIQKAAGGVAGALKQTPIANWLRNHNPGGYEQAVENFTRSCAGYCVATYVLGIGDRHNDNIMVNKHGFLFHIDFGHFLGHYKKVLYMRRERAPFVLTPEFANVMGSKGSDTFNKFIAFCIEGFNVVRKHANVFINLFAMMLSTGIPELQSENDIEYLRQALVVHMSDEEAGKHFTKLINESLDSMSTQVMFVTHIIAHPN